MWLGTSLPFLQISGGEGGTKQGTTAEMERLNLKYNLDCFSDSELDSESEEGEQYHYEYGCETLI